MTSKDNPSLGNGEKTVLVVDDDLDTLSIVSAKLEAHDFKVVTARDGGETLRQVRKHKPDLIILDIMMPWLDGFTVARLLKSDAKYKHIPLIILTARTQEVDRALGKSVGAELYVTKPFDPGQLLYETRRLLGLA